MLIKFLILNEHIDMKCALSIAFKKRLNSRFFEKYFEN